MGPIISVWPFSLISKHPKIQSNLRTAELFNLLIKKRNSIDTLSYVVSKKVVYTNPEIAVEPNKEIPPMDALYEVYYNQKNLKIVFYFPTETTPKEFGAKFTYTWKENYKYQKRESLDGSFETEYLSRRLTSNERNNLFYYLEDIFAMPKDGLMTLNGIEYLNGLLSYVVIQGNNKYWINPEKVLVLKKETYRNSKTLQKRLEYKNFKEFYRAIILPALVIEKHFNAGNILVEEYKKEIRDIKVNQFISEDIFYVEKEKYNG